MWVLIDERSSIDTEIYVVRDAEAPPVAHEWQDDPILFSDEPYYNVAPSREVAERIVREHNSHAALVAALEMLLSTERGQDSARAYLYPTWEQVNLVRDAIDLGKGK